MKLYKTTCFLPEKLVSLILLGFKETTPRCGFFGWFQRNHTKVWFLWLVSKKPHQACGFSVVSLKPIPVLLFDLSFKKKESVRGFFFFCLTLFAWCGFFETNQRNHILLAPFKWLPLVWEKADKLGCSIKSVPRNFIGSRFLKKFVSTSLRGRYH